MKRTVAGLALTALVGCTDANVTGITQPVVPITGRETASVTAQDLAVTMARTGFTRQEILDHGPAIRNALSIQGGAEFRREGNVAAIFSLMDGSLYVVSQRGGTYVHDLAS